MIEIYPIFGFRILRYYIAKNIIMDSTFELIFRNLVFKQSLLISGIGKRTVMQDYGIHDTSLNKELEWFIICDGIGGVPHGDVAAKTTVETLNNYLKNSLQKEEQLRDKSFFEKGIQTITQKFSNLIECNSEYKQMGCTLCVLINTNTKAYIYWAGDSRLYFFRNNKFTWDTIPHNFSFDLFKKGILTMEEARISETNYITASINGYADKIRYDTNIISLKPGDRILICTDGIWGLFDHTDLINVFSKKSLSDIQAYVEPYLLEYGADNYYGYIIDF